MIIILFLFYSLNINGSQHNPYNATYFPPNFQQEEAQEFNQAKIIRDFNDLMHRHIMTKYITDRQVLSLANIIVAHPQLFQTCMAQDATSSLLRAYSKKIRNSGCKPEMWNTKINILIQMIHATSKEQFEKIDPLRGQALIHDFTPWHWSPVVMNILHQKGINLALACTSPHNLENSTMAHYVANIIANRECDSNPSSCRFNHRAFDFLVWYWNLYPETLQQKSHFVNRQMLTESPMFPWQILSKFAQQKIYGRLYVNAKNIINQQMPRPTD